MLVLIQRFDSSIYDDILNIEVSTLKERVNRLIFSYMNLIILVKCK